jgi:hypothetical protein
MPRNLDSTMSAALGNPNIWPARLVMLTFKSQTMYLWTGTGNLVWDGQTFLGMGLLGTIGEMVEGIEVQTQGTSVGLSGINADDLAEALSDVYMGAPALIWFALLAPGPQSGPVVIGTPYLMWSGNVGQPAINVGREEIGHALARKRHGLPATRLESPLHRRRSGDQLPERFCVRACRGRTRRRPALGLGTIRVKPNPMALTKIQHWQTRAFHEFLISRARAPFVWGVNDCALFAADGVLAITGVDSPASFAAATPARPRRWR